MVPRFDNLPAVRRIEAVGFRAWPAASIRYDGSWQVRVTPGHGSRRLNSVVPLDPSDSRDIDSRLTRAGASLAAAGHPLLVRETPLAPPAMIDWLAADGWRRIETVAVMTADLTQAVLPEVAMDHIPSQDPRRFAEACLAVHPDPAVDLERLVSILSAIEPPAGFFIHETPEAGPVATVLAVQDNDLAGIQSMAVKPDHRRQGLAREMLVSALRWSRMRGARTAWLQCRAENAAAISLYEQLGFVPLYHYHYWQKDGRS